MSEKTKHNDYIIPGRPSAKGVSRSQAPGSLAEIVDVDLSSLGRRSP